VRVPNGVNLRLQENSALGLGLGLSARGIDKHKIWHTCALVYLVIVFGCLPAHVSVACACAVGMV